MSAEDSNYQDSNGESNTNKKSKNKNKKRRNISSDEDNSNTEENENEEEEEDSSGNNDDKKKQKKEKDNIDLKMQKVVEETLKKTKDEYIAQIEQLENELQLEQKISQSLDTKIENNDELIYLQKNLDEKKNKLSQLIKTNKRQENALLNLKKQVFNDDDKSRNKNNIKELRLITSNSYKNAFQRNNMLLSINQRKSLDDSKFEAINIVIKIKEKAINNALIKMNILKKENEILRKELYKNNDYSDNLGLEDYTNENKKKLDKLKDEIRILNNQLDQHKKCINERNKLEKENLELKKHLQEIKRNIKQIKSEMQERNNNEIISNSIPLETNEDNSTNNNNSPRNNNTKTIANTKIKTHQPIPVLNLSKSIEGVKLPLITSPANATINKIEKSVITDEFYSKLKTFFEENENEYDILVKKIKEIENSRNYIENKHKNEIKQFDSKIIILDKQFKLLNNEGKENGSNIRVLKYRLNIIKNETRNIFNKIQQIRSKVDFLTNIAKEKDFEIFELKAEIEKIRNKSEKHAKEETIDSNELDSAYDDSESIFNIKKTKRKKIPILNLQDSAKKKKKKKK